MKNKINKTELINDYIIKGRINPSKISDGYHTFEELYDHRATLYIALCRVFADLKLDSVWRSKKHSDNTTTGKEWFILGIGEDKGSQITYHLPISRWKETRFAHTRKSAPEWDKHTSADVLKRLRSL